MLGNAELSWLRFEFELGQYMSSNLSSRSWLDKVDSQAFARVRLTYTPNMDNYLAIMSNYKKSDFHNISIRHHGTHTKYHPFDSKCMHIYVTIINIISHLNDNLNLKNCTHLYRQIHICDVV